MPYILVATDLSKVSENAVRYSAHLAAAHNRDLVIVHAFTFPVTTGDLPLPSSVINDMQTDTEEQIADLIREMSDICKGIRVKSIVNYGNIFDTIRSYVQENGSPWLVAMGNSNPAGSTPWFLSTLKDAISDLGHPILAIPPTASYHPIDRICFATDIEHPDHHDTLQAIVNLSVKMNAALLLFDSHQGVGSDRGQETGEPRSAARAAQHAVYTDTEESIHAFCTENKIDWLAIIPEHYSFFESLFRDSQTKQLAKIMEIPLLILHEEYES